MFGRNNPNQSTNIPVSGAFGSAVSSQGPQQPLFGAQSQPTAAPIANLSGGWPSAQPNRAAPGATTAPFGGSTGTGSAFGSSSFGGNSMAGGLRGLSGTGQRPTSGLGVGSSWTAGSASAQPLALTVAPSQGTGQVNFRPVPSTETTAHGTKQVLFDSIAFLSGYESKSFEELRFEDYQLGNRGQGSNSTSAVPTGGGSNAHYGNTGASSTTGAGLFGAKPASGISTAGGLFGSAGNTGTTSNFQTATNQGTGFGLLSNTQNSGGGLFGSAASGGIFGNNSGTATNAGFSNVTQSTGRPGGLFGGAGSSASTPTPFGTNQSSGAGTSNPPFGSNLFGSGASASVAPFSSATAANPFGVISQSSGAQTPPNAQSGPSSSFVPGNVAGAPGSSSLFGARPASNTNPFSSANTAQAGGTLSASASPFGSASGANPVSAPFGGITSQPSGGFASGASTMTSGFGTSTGNQVPNASNTPQNFSFGGFGATQTNPAGVTTNLSGGGPSNVSGGMLPPNNAANMSSGATTFQFGGNDSSRANNAGFLGNQSQNTSQSSSGLFRFGPASNNQNVTNQQPGAGGNFVGNLSGTGAPTWRPFADTATNATPYQNMQGSQTGAPPGIGFASASTYGPVNNAVQPLTPTDYRSQNASSSKSPYGPLPVLSTSQTASNAAPAGRWNELQAAGERSQVPSAALTAASLASIPNAPVSSYRVRPRSQVRAFSYGASVGGVSLDTLFDRQRDGIRGALGQAGTDSWSGVIAPGLLRRAEAKRPERGVKQLILEAAASGHEEPTLTLADITTQEALMSSPGSRFDGRDLPNGEENRPYLSTPSFGAEMSPIVPSRNAQTEDHSMPTKARATPSAETKPGAHVEYHAQTRTSATSNDDGSEKHLPSWVPRLTKPGYYTRPPIHELQSMSEEALARVSHFVIGRKNIAEIRFLEPVDLRHADLDQIVHIEPRTVVLYPNEEPKWIPDAAPERDQRNTSSANRSGSLPPAGKGLNHPALLRFEQVFRMDKRTGKPTSDPEAIARFTQRLREYAEQQRARFVSYDAESGTWELLVDQFG
jgi:nuclear pore complex protein Nup98-Nup96